jgi:hypothetical protein
MAYWNVTKAVTGITVILYRGYKVNKKNKVTDSFSIAMLVLQGSKNRVGAKK